MLDIEHAYTIDVMQVAPANPRHNVPPEGITELANSIEQMGLLVPMTGYEDNGTIFITAGGRRLRAIKQLVAAGRVEDQHWPVILRDYEDAISAGIIDEFSKNRLTDRDELFAFLNHVNNNATDEELAHVFGRDVRWCKRRRRLGQLPAKALNLIFHGTLSVEHGIGLTYFEPESELFDDAIEWCKRDPSVTIRQLRNRANIGGQPFASHVESRIVSLQEYIDAGGKVQEDLFADATLILDPELLTELAMTFVRGVAQMAYPDSTIIDLDPYHFPRTLQVPSQLGEDEEEEYVGFFAQFPDIDDVDEIDEIMAERAPADAERFRELHALDNPAVPDDVLAMLDVGVRLSRNDPVGYQIFPAMLPDRTDPRYQQLIDMDMIPGRKTDDRAEDEAQQDAAEAAAEEAPQVSNAVAADIEKIMTHVVQQVMIEHPERVMRLYAYHVADRGSYRPMFSHVPEFYNQLPDDFTGIKVSKSWERLTKKSETSSPEKLAGAKPDLVLEYLAFKMLRCLTRNIDLDLIKKAGKTEIRPVDVRTWWTPDLTFLSRYKKDVLNDMLEQLDPKAHADLVGRVAGMPSKAQLAETLAEAAASHDNWLPVGFLFDQG
jgi:ParB/RepB/Spo0J family partition protein